MGFSNRETGLRQAAEAPAEPTLISQRLLCFRRGFQLGANRIRCYFLSKAFVVRSVARGKKSRGIACAFWALLSRALSSCLGFTLLSRTKHTQSQPCGNVRGLGWHSMHTPNSRCRQQLAFGSGPQVDSRKGSVPSSQERRGDRIPEHRPLLNGEHSGIVATPFPAHPQPPTTLSHLEGRWHLTARFSRELFL